MKKLWLMGLLSALVANYSAHAQTVSPDGTILVQNLSTSDGTWTFGAASPQDPGNWAILLNGASAQGWFGSELEVASDGQMYARGVTTWWVWQNGAWNQSSGPPSNPATPPDAGILLPSLQTADGTWTFGAGSPQNPGNWAILLNGASAQGWFGSELEVASGGQMYARGVTTWWVWQNGAWTQSSGPPSSNPVPPSNGTIVLRVGPGGQYQAISDAVAAADADTNLGNYYDIQVIPGTYTNDFPNVTRPMTIEVDPSYAGSPVVLQATEPLPNEKGIILATANLTVNGLTFTGAAIDNSLGGNGAGIRNQNIDPGGELTILNSTFIGNQEGVLTDPRSADETITVTNSNFINNGNPDINNFQHGLYVNAGISLTVSNSLFCGQLIGHDIKSRTQATIITNNRLYDGAGNAALGCDAGSTSFAIDIPNGGQASISGNQIIQGAASQNFKMVDYGEEGLDYNNNSLVVSGNNFTSSGVPAIAIYDPFCVIAQLSNNTFSGIDTIVYPDGCAVFQ